MSRRLLASFFVGTIALGGASRLLPVGAPIWDKSFGDGAYAAMVFFIVAFLRPGARSLVIGASALAICVAIECFQLTGIPARLPRLLQIALGTRFAWHDIVCYAAGASVATLLHALLSSRLRPRSAA